jgi:hypothetical protein
MTSRPRENGRSSAGIVQRARFGRALAGHHPVTVVHHRATVHRRARIVFALSTVVIGLAISACASTAPATPGSAQASSPSQPASPSESPIGTFWPQQVPRAIVALGAGDNEIRKAGVDMAAAVDAEDLSRMWGVADGLATLTYGLLPHARAVAGYAPFAGLGQNAVTALTHLHDGSVALRDAITAGKADRILAASTAIGQALDEYGAVRPGLSDLVPEALRQQRALLK